MKHIILAAIFILALFTVGYGAEIGPSPEKTADAIITANPGGQYAGMVVLTDGTNNCTVKVYDSATGADGKVVDDGICSTYTCKYLFPWPTPYSNGLYVDITTAGTCTYIIYYK
jgi:hypothetical protein